MKRKCRRLTSLIITLIMLVTLFSALPVNAASPQKLGDVEVYVGMSVNDVKDYLRTSYYYDPDDPDGLTFNSLEGMFFSFDDYIEHLNGNEIIKQQDISYEKNLNLGNGFSTKMTKSELRRNCQERGVSISFYDETQTEEIGGTGYTSAVIVLGDYTVRYFWESWGYQESDKSWFVQIRRSYSNSSVSIQKLGDVAVYIGMTVNEVRAILGRESDCYMQHGAAALKFNSTGTVIGLQNVFSDQVNGNEVVVYQEEWSERDLGSSYNTKMTMAEVKNRIIKDQGITPLIEEYEAWDGFYTVTNVLLGNYQITYSWLTDDPNEKSTGIEIWKSDKWAAMETPTLSKTDMNITPSGSGQEVTIFTASLDYEDYPDHDILNEFTNNVKVEIDNNNQSPNQMTWEGRWVITSDGKTAEYKCKFTYKKDAQMWLVATSSDGQSVKSLVSATGGNDSATGIYIMSTQKSLTIEQGDSLNLSFGLAKNGDLDENWKRMAIVVSDPTVVSTSSYREEEYGYSIEVKGNKVGYTNIVISDTETGLSNSVVITVVDQYIKTYSYDINDIGVFYPNNNYEKHIATNIYDVNGIYVNNYSSVKVENGYRVSFDAYNEMYYTGAVDIYNKDGTWNSCEEITKFTNPQSVVDTFYLGKNHASFFGLITDAFTGKLLTYEQDSFSRKSSLSFIVPEGGYFTISNNMAESPGTYLYNVCDIIFEAACTLIDVKVNVSDVDITAFDKLFTHEDEFKKSLIQKVLESNNSREMFLDAFRDTQIDETKKFSQKVISGDISNACEIAAGSFDALFTSLDIDWREALDASLSLGENVLTTFMGPAGIALKGCFAMQKEADQISQIIQMAYSLEKTYVTVYSSFKDGMINSHGIVVDTNGNIDSETHLQVFKIIPTDPDVWSIINPDMEEYIEYNISFVKNDQLVQPSGKVKVKIPISNRFNRLKEIHVFRKETNGSWTLIPGKIEGDYIVFETEHFSDYILTGSVADIKLCSLPNKTNYYAGDVLELEGLSLTVNGNVVDSGFICTPPVLMDEGEQTITVIYGKTTTKFTVNVKKSFFDIHPSDYFFNAVLWAVENGITNGTSATTFSPNDGCTRAQVVTFLWRAAGKPSVSTSVTFSDVPKNEYYTDAVAWAVNKGITNGVGNNRFDPNATCTRAQIVTFLWRYKGSPSASTNSGFSDVPSNEYYAAPVTWAVQNKITNGVGDNKFDPNATCTRGQVVTFLYRSKDVKANETQPINPTPVDPTPVNPTPVEKGSIKDSWDTIIASINNGSYKNKYKIGDTKSLDLGSEGNIEMQIAAFDTDELADGSGKAPITWIAKQSLKSNHGMTSYGNALRDPNNSSLYKENTGTIGGWEKSDMRDWLSKSIVPLLPSEVQKSIKQVKKYSIIYNTSGEMVNDSVSIDDIWIPSAREIGAHEVNGFERTFENNGPQYKGLFKSDDDRIREFQGVPDWVSSWWLRSAESDIGFWGIYNKNGSTDCVNSDYPWAVIIGFCLGSPSEGQTSVDYTVTFNSNGGSSVPSQKVREYKKFDEPDEPTKGGSTFDGWFTDSSLTKAYNFDSLATKNLTLYAKWEDDIIESDSISDSWERIIDSVNDGTYKSKYHIGETKTLDLGSEGKIEMQIAAFDADELTDGTGKAAITWISKQMLKTDRRMDSGHYNQSGWVNTELRSWLQSELKSKIPSSVQNAIKTVTKYTTYNQSSEDDIWIPSGREVVPDKKYDEYEDETIGPKYSDLFKSNNDLIKHKKNKPRALEWWLRSGIAYYGYIDTDGKIGGYALDDAYDKGVVIGFCM